MTRSTHHPTRGVRRDDRPRDRRVAPALLRSVPPRRGWQGARAAAAEGGGRRRAKASPRRSAGAGGDVGAADGAPRHGLDPGHGAGPVEAVRAGQARHHVPRAELLQAHRTLCLRVRLGRRRAPSAGQTAPAEPARSSLPRPRRRRQHLPLQQHAAGRRRCRVVAVVTVAVAAAARCVVVRFGRRGSRAHMMPASRVSPLVLSFISDQQGMSQILNLET